MPNLRLAGVSPVSRIKAGGNSTELSYFGGAGYPLGILMAITYIQSNSNGELDPLVSTEKPHVRIK